MFDGKAFGVEIVGVVKAHVERSIAPLLTQMEAMRSDIAALKAVPAPKDGKDADPEAVAALMSADVRKDIDALRGSIEALPTVPELPDIPALIAEAVEAQNESHELSMVLLTDAIAKVELGYKQAIADIPHAPEPIIMPDIPALIAEAMAALPEVDLKAMVDAAVDAIPAAENGKDADPELVASLVAETVERAVAAIPAPKNGDAGADGVTLEELLPIIDQEVAKAVSAIRVPKDGLDAVEFFRAENGHLIVTMSNGTTRDLGQYIGKDGADGKNGADAIVDMPDVDLAVVNKMIEDAVAKHTVEPIEFAPDEVAANVSLTVKMMAETPQTVSTHQRSEAQPINVSVTMPEMKAADTTVNVSMPRPGAERVQVTEHAADGRIKSYVKTPIDEA